MDNMKSHLIKPIEVTITQYLYNNRQYNTKEEAKLAAIEDLLPTYDYIEWLMDPYNLQKIIDLG